MTHLITAWLAFNAGAATVVLWRYWCERRMDRDADLCAVMDATSEPFVLVDLTPHIAALNEAAAEMAIPAYERLLLEEWAKEVATNADAELAELVEEEGS